MKKIEIQEKLTVNEQLREIYPHGHPDFIEKSIAEIELHSSKNYDYAAGGDPLGNFKRVANILSMYPGLDIADAAIVAMVFALKQIDAALWQMSQHHTCVFEDAIDRWKDVSVYAKLIQILIEEEGGETND